MYKIIISAFLLITSGSAFGQQDDSQKLESQTTIATSEKKAIDSKQTIVEIETTENSTPELKRMDKKNNSRTNTKVPELKKYSKAKVNTTSTKAALPIKKKKAN
jgi:hypothetical protein